jgi:hypothetical protein
MSDYNLGNLVYKITGDNSGLKTSMNESKGIIDKAPEWIKKVGVAIAGAFAVDKIIDFGKEITNAANKAENISKRFGVVFSGIPDTANAAAAELAKNYDMTNSSAKELLLTTGQYAQSLGVSQQASLEMSVKLNSLAADMASFSEHEGGASAASQALTRALSGQVRGLREFGLAINETQLNAYVESIGQSTKFMTEAEKAQMMLNIVVKQASAMTGDYSKNSDSLYNIQNRIETQNKQLVTSLGEKMLPAVKMAGIAWIELSKAGGPLKNMLATVVEYAAKLVLGLSYGALQLTKMYEITKNKWAISDSMREFITVENEASIMAGKLGVTLNKLRLEYKLGEAGVNGFISGQKFNRSLTIEQADVLNKYITALEKHNKAVQTGAESSNEASKAIDEAAKNFEKYWKQVETGTSAEEKHTKSINDGKLAAAEAKKKLLELKMALASGLGANLDPVTGGLHSMAAALDNIYLNIKKIGKDGPASFIAVMTVANAVTNTVMGIAEAANKLVQALYKSRIDNLDNQMKKEEEAQGVAEQTAVQKAQSEYEAAVKTGNQQEIIDKKKALTKATIEENYAKKKAKLEYQMAMASWDFQVSAAGVQMAMAPLNALASGFAAPAWMQPWFPIMLAGVAETMAGINFAAVVASKPHPPQLAGGGITGGGSVIVGEMGPERVDLPAGSRVHSTQESSAGTLYQVAPMDKQMMYDDVFQASRDGRLFIAERAMVKI